MHDATTALNRAHIKKSRTWEDEESIDDSEVGEKIEINKEEVSSKEKLVDVED
jgi:hypothetical protein